MLSSPILLVQEGNLSVSHPSLVSGLVSVLSLRKRIYHTEYRTTQEEADAQGWAMDSATPLSLKSLCGGGMPSSHPSLGLSVFFLKKSRRKGKGSSVLLAVAHP